MFRLKLLLWPQKQKQTVWECMNLLLFSVLTSGPCWTNNVLHFFHFCCGFFVETEAPSIFTSRQESYGPPEMSHSVLWSCYWHNDYVILKPSHWNVERIWIYWRLLKYLFQPLEHVFIILWLPNSSWTHVSAGPVRAAKVAEEVPQSISSHPGQEKHHSDHHQNPRGARWASFEWQYLLSVILQRLSTRFKLPSGTSAAAVKAPNSQWHHFKNPPEETL